MLLMILGGGGNTPPPPSKTKTIHRFLMILGRWVSTFPPPSSFEKYENPTVSNDSEGGATACPPSPSLENYENPKNWVGSTTKLADLRWVLVWCCGAKVSYGDGWPQQRRCTRTLRTSNRLSIHHAVRGTPGTKPGS